MGQSPANKGDWVQLEFVYQLKTYGLIKQNELSRYRGATNMIGYGTVMNVPFKFFLAT